MSTLAPDVSPPDVVMIDNYDSFTFNLVQYLEELGARVTVFRHDKITGTRGSEGLGVWHGTKAHRGTPVQWMNSND